MSADGPVRPAGQTVGPGQASGWPVWSGAVPPLAEGFTVRPDTVPDLETALVPGVTVVLVPDQAAASAQDDASTQPPSAAACAKVRAERHLPPVTSYDTKPGAVRVFELFAPVLGATASLPLRPA